MKSLFAFLLCLCLLLSACGTTPPATEPTTAPTTNPTTQPTETTVPSTSPTEPEPEQPQPQVTEPLVFDLPMSAIVLTHQQENLEEGAFPYRYQNVRLYLPVEGISENVTLELLNRIDSTRTQAEAAQRAGNTGYTVTYIPRRIDTTVLSLSGTENTFSAESHPLTVCTGVTYDLITGQVLTLTDVLTEESTRETICRLVVDALSALETECRLYPDFSLSVESRFSGEFQEDEAWYLSEAGLCFDFEPYEIAPYSSGIVTATIPYESLPGVLRDEWFPVEQISSEGTLTASLYADADQSAIDLYAEVILDAEGEKFLLYPEGLLYQVTVETGSWNLAGTEFIPDATVFAADHLTAGDGIMIQTFVPDVLSNIRITYTTDRGTTQVYLSQSGIDGSALLVQN